MTDHVTQQSLHAIKNVQRACMGWEGGANRFGWGGDNMNSLSSVNNR